MLDFKYKPLIYYLRYLLDPTLKEDERKELIFMAANIINQNLNKINSSKLKKSYLKIRYHEIILEEVKKYETKS